MLEITLTLGPLHYTIRLGTPNTETWGEYLTDTELAEPEEETTIIGFHNSQ